MPKYVRTPGSAPTGSETPGNGILCKRSTGDLPSETRFANYQQLSAKRIGTVKASPNVRVITSPKTEQLRGL